MVEETKQIKNIDASSVIKKISAIDNKIAITEDKHKRHFVKYNGTILCFIMDQKYGVAVRKRVGGKWTTVRLTNDDEVNKEISVLKQQMTTP